MVDFTLEKRRQIIWKLLAKKNCAYFNGVPCRVAGKLFNRQALWMIKTVAYLL